MFLTLKGSYPVEACDPFRVGMLRGDSGRRALPDAITFIPFGDIYV
jgi:hypothetical protein